MRSENKWTMKRLLSLLLALTMVLSMLPVAVFADAADVTTAEGLKTAVEAGGEVKLGADIALSENLIIPAGKTVTLDLNGKTLSLGSGYVGVQGTLTVNDSTATTAPAVSDDGNYTVTYTSGKITSSDTAVWAYSGGNFTLESGMVESTGGTAVWSGLTSATAIASTVNINGGYVLAQEFGVAAGHASTINVSGGVIEAKDNAVLGGNGTTGVGGYTINVTGGTLIGRIQTSGYASCGIYHPNTGTVSVSGGTIISTKGAGIVARAGQTNVTGGTIIALGDNTFVGKVGDSKVTVSTSGIVLDLAASYPGAAVVGGKATNANVTVSGTAEVSGTKSAVDVVETYGGKTVTEDDNVAISGGSYSTPVDPDYLDGLTVELKSATNTDAPYSYYASVEDALADAQDGDTVTNLSASKTITVTEVTDLTVFPSTVQAGDTFTVQATTSSDTGKVQFTYGTQKKIASVDGDLDGTGLATCTFVAETGVTQVTAIHYSSTQQSAPLTKDVTLATPDTYYTVTYLPGAADGYIPFTPTTVSVKEGDSHTLPTDIPTREGYEFKGWSDGTTTYAAGATIPASAITGDVTLNAKWEAETVNITYTDLASVDGVGYVGTPSISVIKGSTVYFTLGLSDGYDPATLMVKAGDAVLNPIRIVNSTANQYQYSFVAKADTTVSITGPSKLTYTVTMPVGHFTAKITRANGADVAAPGASASVEYGKDYTFAVTPDTGYEIKHVYVNGEDKGTGGSYTVTNVTSAQTVEVVVDEIPIYTVTYVVNNAQYTTQKVTSGETIGTLPEAPDVTGYTFGGWYTAQNGGGTKVETTTTVSNDMTVYAKLTANTYTITYVKNAGGDDLLVANMPSNTTKTHGIAATLENKIPTCDGRTFLGWSTNKDAETPSYQPGDGYSTDADITLYAVWKPITYTVTLPNGTGYTAMPKTGSSSPVKFNQSYSFTVTVDPEYVLTTPVVKANSTQLNASSSVDNPDGSTTYTYTISSIRQNQVVSVQVTKNPVYTVTFQYTIDGVTTTYQTQQVEHNAKATVPNPPSVEGYTFEGWYKADLTTLFPFNEAITGTTTVYGKMTAITPEVTWTASGTGWTLAVTSAEVTDPVSDSNPDGDAINVSPNTVKYGSAMEFTVTIDEGYDAANLAVAANGLALAPVEVTANADKTVDYKFVLSNITADQQITVVGVARKMVTITYNDNGGIGGPVQEQVPYYLSGASGNGKISLVEPTRVGYEFKGWAKADATTGEIPETAEYGAGEANTFTADTTLYAVWSAKETTVTLTVDKTSQYEGENVVLTADVKSGTDAVTSGSVQFYRSNNGATTPELVGTVKVSGGKAALSVATSAYEYGKANTDSYTAKFIPDEGSGYSEKASSAETVTVLSTAISWELTTSDAIADKGNELTIYNGTVTTGSGATTAQTMTAGRTYTLELPDVYALDDQNTALTALQDYTVTWQKKAPGQDWTTIVTGSGDTYTVTSYEYGTLYRAIVIPLAPYTKAADYGADGALVTDGTYALNLTTEPTSEVARQETDTTLVALDLHGVPAPNYTPGAEFEGQDVTLKATVKLSGTNTTIDATGEVYFYKGAALIGKADVQSDGTAVLEGVTISDYDRNGAHPKDIFKAVYQTNDTYETSTSAEVDVLIRSTAIAWAGSDTDLDLYLGIGGSMTPASDMYASNTYTIEVPNSVIEEAQSSILLGLADYEIEWFEVAPDGVVTSLGITDSRTKVVTPAEIGTTYYAHVLPKDSGNYTCAYEDGQERDYLTSKLDETAKAAPTITTLTFGDVLPNTVADDTPDYCQYEGKTITITAKVVEAVITNSATGSLAAKTPEEVVQTGTVTFYVVTKTDGTFTKIGTATVNNGLAAVSYKLPDFDPADGLDNIKYFFAVYTDTANIFADSNTTSDAIAADATAVPVANIDKDTEAVQILSTSISWAVTTNTTGGVTTMTLVSDANKLTIYEGTDTTGDTTDTMIAGSTYTLQLPAVYALDYAVGATTEKLTVNKDYNVTWQYFKTDISEWVDYTSTSAGDTVLVTPDYSGYQFRAVVTPIYDNDALTGYKTAAEYTNNVVSGKTEYLLTVPTKQTVRQATTTALEVSDTQNLPGVNAGDPDIVAEFEGQKVTLTATVTLKDSNPAVKVTTGEVYFYKNGGTTPIGIAPVKSDGTATFEATISKYERSAGQKDTFTAVYQTNDTYQTSISNTAEVRVRSTAIAWTTNTAGEVNALTIYVGTDTTSADAVTTTDPMVAGNTYTLELPTVVEDGQSGVELTAGTDYTVTWWQVNSDGTRETLETTETDTFEVSPATEGVQYYAQVNPKDGSNYTKAYQDGGYQNYLTTDWTEASELHPTTIEIAFGNVLTNTSNTPDFSQYEEIEIKITATVKDEKGGFVDHGFVDFYVVTGEGTQKISSNNEVSNGKATEFYTLPKFAINDSLNNIEYFFAIYTDSIVNFYETSSTASKVVSTTTDGAVETEEVEVTVPGDVTVNDIDADTEAVQILSTSISWAVATNTNSETGVTTMTLVSDANKLTIYEADEDGSIRTKTVGGAVTKVTADKMIADNTYVLELPPVYALDYAAGGTTDQLTVNVDYTVVWQYWETGISDWVTYVGDGTGDTVVVTPDYSGYQFRAVVTPIYDNQPLSNYKTAAQYDEEGVVIGKINSLYTEPTPKTELQPTTTTLTITAPTEGASAWKAINGADVVFYNEHLAQFEGQTVTLNAAIKDASNALVQSGIVYFYRYVDGTNDVLLNETAIEVVNGVAQLEKVVISDYNTALHPKQNIDQFYAVYQENATYDDSSSLPATGTPSTLKHTVYIKSTTIQTPIIDSAEAGKLNDTAKTASNNTTYKYNLTDLLAGVRHTFTLRTGADKKDWSVVALDGREVAAENYDIQWLVTTGSNEEQAPNDAKQATFVVEESKSGDKYRVKLTAKNDMTVDAYSNYAVISSLQNVTVLVTASDEIKSTDATDVYQLNNITLTAEVQGRDSQIMLPTGNVTFYYSVDNTTWVEIGTAALKLDDVSDTMKASIETDKLPVDVANGYTMEDVIVTAVYLGDTTFNPSDNLDADGKVTNDAEDNITAGDYVQPDEVTVYSSVVFVSEKDENMATASPVTDGIHISVTDGSLIANETDVVLGLSQIYTLDHDIELSKLTYGKDYTVQWQVLNNVTLYNDNGYYGGTDKWVDIYNENGPTYTIPTVTQDAAYRARITVVNTAAPVQGSAQGVKQATDADITTGREVYYSNVLIVGAGMATMTTNITTSANRNFNEEGIVEGETVTIHALVAGVANVTPISLLTAVITDAQGKEVFSAREGEGNVDGYTFFSWNTTGVTPGYYTLTLTATSNNGYAPQVITRTLIVRDDNYKLTATKESKVYNGKAQGIDWTLEGIDIENTLAQASVVVHYYDKDNNLVEPSQAGTYRYELILPASAYWTQKSVTGTFTIEQRKVSVVDLIAQAKVYDGTDNANIQEIILNDAETYQDSTGLPKDDIGVINGDSVYAVGTGYTTSVSAGKTSLGVKNVTLMGDDAANYDLVSYSYTEEFNIQRNQLKGDIADVTYAYTGSNIYLLASDVYLIDQAGNVLTDYTVTYYYHNGDGVEKVSAMNQKGMYTVIVGKDANYKGGASQTVYVAGTAKDAEPDKTAVSAIISITNTVELYGQTTGIQASATNGAATTVSYYVNGTLTTTAPTDAGRYLVKVTTNTGDTAYGIYTIVKAHPELELTAEDAIYNSAQISGNPTLTNNGDDTAEVYYTWTGGTIQGVAYQAPTEAGTYVVTAHVGETDNYTAHEVSAIYTIEPKKLTITANDLQRWQYGSIPDMVATYTGLATEGVAPDTSLRDIPVQPEFIFNEGKGGYTNDALDQVGLEYIITVRNALAPNYDITYVAGNYAVTREEPKAELAIHGMIDNGTDVENIAYYGDKIQLYAYGYYQANGNGTGVYNTSSLIEWSVSDNSIASIDEDGLLTITGVGEFTVTLTRGTGTSAISTSIRITAKPQEVKLNVADRDAVYTGKNYTYSITNSNVSAVDAKAAAVKAINTDKASTIKLVDGSSNVRLDVGSQVVTVKVSDSVTLYVSEAYGGLFTLNDKEVEVAPKEASVVYGAELGALSYTETGTVNNVKALTNANAVSIRNSYVNLDVLDGYEILVAGTENKNYNVKYVTDQAAEDVNVKPLGLTVSTGTLNNNVGMTSGSKNPLGDYPAEGAVVNPDATLGASNVRMYGEPNWVMVYGLDKLIKGDSLADLAELESWLVKFDYTDLHNIAENANLAYPDKGLMSGKSDYSIDTKIDFANYTLTVDKGTQNIYQRPVVLSTIDGTGTIDVFVKDAKDPELLKAAIIEALKAGKYNGEGGLATLLNHTIEDLDLQLEYTYNVNGFNVTITVGNPNYWLANGGQKLTIHIDVVRVRYIVEYRKEDFTASSTKVTVYRETEDGEVLTSIPEGLNYAIYVKNNALPDDYDAYVASGASPARSGTMTERSTGVYTASYSRLVGSYQFFAVPATEDYLIVYRVVTTG